MATLSDGMIKVSFFPEEGIEVPASRIRCYYMSEMIKKCGVESHVIWPPRGGLLSNFGHIYTIRRATPLLTRFPQFFSADSSNILIFQRGIDRWGIPNAIRFINKIKSKTVFDFDDAIFLQIPEQTDIVLRNVDYVTCGSHYIFDYAKERNPNTFLVPTCIDSNKYHQKQYSEKKRIVIGWIGSISTLKYLQIMQEPLERLARRYPMELRIIGASRYNDLDMEFKGLKLSFVKWSLENEIADLSKFDIGIMPLFESEWEKGKCGFKLIQYMGMGIPSVGSDLGENRHIIDHGKNGFLASSCDDWYGCLKDLITDVHLREKIGRAGRKTAVKGYSFQTWAPRFKKILKRLNDEHN